MSDLTTFQQFTTLYHGWWIIVYIVVSYVAAGVFVKEWNWYSEEGWAALTFFLAPIAMPIVGVLFVGATIMKLLE